MHALYTIARETFMISMSSFVHFRMFHVHMGLCACVRVVFACVRAGSRALITACIEANHGTAEEGEARAAMLHILPNAAPSEHESTGRVVLPEAPAARRAAKRPKSGACG
jgi:hypothetical protein